MRLSEGRAPTAKAVNVSVPSVFEVSKETRGWGWNGGIKGELRLLI